MSFAIFRLWLRMITMMSLNQIADDIAGVTAALRHNDKALRTALRIEQEHADKFDAGITLTMIVVSKYPLTVLRYKPDPYHLAFKSIPLYLEKLFFIASREDSNAQDFPR